MLKKTTNRPIAIQSWFCLLGVFAGFSLFATEPGMQARIHAARDQVYPALVHIEVITRTFAGGRGIKGRSGGSGTIISSQGHILTNEHVTRDGISFRVFLEDDTVVTADLVGDDPLTDLAVLKLKMQELPPHYGPLPIAKFGESHLLQPGDYVLAMGSPYTLSRSITLGVVSNTQRVFGPLLGGHDLGGIEIDRGRRTGLFTVWIQHDAAINPGNSGGPLVNLAGEIIGVNELGGAEIGFAIPSSLAQEVADNLIKSGEVTRSWIGLIPQAVRDTHVKEGVLVASVIQNSPADVAGFQPGDQWLALDGEPLQVTTVEGIPPLLKRLADYPVGSRLQCDIRRGEQRLQLAVTTQKLPQDGGSCRVYPDWGLVAEEVTPKTAIDLGLKKHEGVMVHSVRSGGPAEQAMPPLSANDVLLRIGLLPIHSLQDLDQAYENWRLGETALVRRFDFLRQNSRIVAIVQPREAASYHPIREVARIWTGLVTQPVYGDYLAPGQPAGYLVNHIYQNTPAAKSGLQSGDLLIAVNGRPLEVVGPKNRLRDELRDKAIGDLVSFSVWRDGRTSQYPLTLGRTPAGPDELPRFVQETLECTFRSLTFYERNKLDENNLPAGLRVLEMDGNGPLGLAGVEPGDILTRLNGHPVLELTQISAAIADMALSQSNYMPLQIVRGHRVFHKVLYLESVTEIKGAPAKRAKKESGL